jgi:hypothetical protein
VGIPLAKGTERGGYSRAIPPAEFRAAFSCTLELVSSRTWSASALIGVGRAAPLTELTEPTDLSLFVFWEAFLPSWLTADIPFPKRVEDFSLVT